MTAAAERFGLGGQVAVVTGASAGLGVQFAHALGSAGAAVVVAARRADRLESLSKDLEDAGVECLAVACDVSRAEDVDRLVAETQGRFGRIDVLVNNAGITEVVPAEEESLATFQNVVAVNLTGLFLCAQRVGRVMLEAGRGSVVNVGSILGLVGSGQVPQASYAASKGGVVNLTRELAAQWARRGVRVNAIAPGWFESEMTAEKWNDAGNQKWMRTRTPMGRPGRPGELDGALLFLASEASAFVTGQILAVDGGWTIV
ncbi:MAG: glucose 1-dehydrogenase [Proteobacteria bacterium]|nr:glucose 1-dehydrogenase [Pseudomonadota bacterium]